MKRRTLFIAAVAAVFGLAGMLVAVMHTRFALHLAVSEAIARSNGALHVGSVDGSLSGPFTLHDVQIDTASFSARIGTITFDWLPLNLFANRLEITSLSASDVDLTVKQTHGGQPFQFVRPLPPHLPVILIVKHLNIDGVHLHAPQLTQTLQIAHITSSARFDNQAWEIPALSVDGEQIHAQGHGRWNFRNGDQIDTALNWQLKLSQMPPIDGQAVLKGDAKQLHFDMSLKEPVQLQLAADIHDLFRNPAWQGNLALNRVHLQRFVSGLPDVDATGSARFSGTPDLTRFSGKLQAREPKTGDWQGDFTLRYQNARLEVEQLQLARATTRTRFQLTGSVNLASPLPEPDLHGEWQALTLPLAGRPWLQLPEGKLRVQSKNGRIMLALDGSLANGGTFTAQGNVDMNTSVRDWRVSASAKNFHLNLPASPQPLPTLNWRLLAHGNAQNTVIDNLGIDTQAGRLRLRGGYQHGSPHNWYATLTGRHLNPGVFFHAYPGDIGFEARIDGRQGSSPEYSVQLKSLQGSLRSAALAGNGKAHFVNGRWLFDNVALQIGDNHIGFDGHIGRKTEINWNINAPDLAALWPGLRGKLDSHGKLELAGSNPVARFNLHARQVHYRHYIIAALDADVTMNNTAQGGDATFKATDIMLDGTPVTALSAQITGTLLSHTLQIALSSPLGNASINGQGKLANDTWQGNLQTVTLEPSGGGKWQTDSAWQPSIGADGIILPQACVTQADARACADASWQHEKWQANVVLSAVPLSDLQSILPPGLEYTGSFGGTLHADGNQRQHSIDLTANLSPGSIHNVIRHQRVTLLDYTHGDAHFHVDSDHTTGALNWTLRDGGFLNLDTRIAHGATPKLNGRVRGELHDFELIPALIPDVSGFEGKFGIDLKLGGTASNPTFDGTASLSDGSIRVPRFGLNISNVLLDLQGNGSHLALKGTAHSGTGDLSWNSSAQKQNGIWRAKGHLQGKDFRTADIPEAQVDISPDLDFTLDNRDITLDGEVVIPYARLRPRNLSNTAQVSDDQVIVGDNQAAQEDRWRIHANVRATMGDKVDIKGFGLSGRITGNVQLVDEPGHFTTGSGELQIVDGQYAAYGQNLNIDRGRLMFNGGPVSNPALDIRALRKPAHPDTIVPGQTEQQVGVVVRGTLHDPSVSLFSNPPLPQTSLLSYLLTGQLPSTPSQSPLIGQPSTDTGEALTYSGGEFLAQQVGNQIGLSDVSIQNVSTGIGTSTPSLFIGKYLSPRLYVSYGTGLLQSINTIRIRYTLSARWMLEAESGAANSADLIYTLEH